MLTRWKTLVPRAALLLLIAAGAAHATGSPLGIGTAEPSVQPLGGPLAPLFLYVNQQQQTFYRALTLSIEGMRHDPDQLWILIGLSFAYGIFHAAGPGHGKAVISSYMVANEIELKRGIAISFVSAFLQGAVAVALVAAAYFVLRGSGITMTQATNTMEITSFVLVILFGCWLLYRKLRSMIREAGPRRQALQFATAAGPVSLSLFDGEPDRRASRQLSRATLRSSPGDAYVCDIPGTDGNLCDSCGKMHLPDPSLLKGENFSLRAAWSAIVTVGLRPCSGALLVLTFSMLNGLWLGGILSVVAMSVGTALTVSLLAIFAVATKGVAVRLAGRGSLLAERVGSGIEILGALMVIGTGVLLLGASLQT